MVFAALYGTGGDILIALSAVTLALLVAGDSAWPTVGYGRIAVIAILIGLSYTRFSEWLNVEIRKAWAYRAAIPVLPLLDIGLSPLLQWLVIPGAAFLVAAGLSLADVKMQLFLRIDRANLEIEFRPWPRRNGKMRFRKPHLPYPSPPRS